MSFEIRFCKGWNREDVEINPDPMRVRELLHTSEIGKQCLGEVAIGSYHQNNGEATFRGATELSLYLGESDSAVVSLDFDRFLRTKESSGQRKPLPVEGGETSNIEECYFVPLQLVEELVNDLVLNGELTGDYECGDPEIYDNLTSLNA